MNDIRDSKRHLLEIFNADRQLRSSESELLLQPTSAVATVLSESVREALAMTDEAEATMRLQRLSDLCAQVPGPEMCDALIAILNHDDPSVRVAAGEAIRDVGYERYAEVARAIERSLSNHLEGAAMQELPWVLAEIGEPSALPLIRSFLSHNDANVVASAIEALVTLGEVDAIDALRELQNDKRMATVDDLEEEHHVTVGELAADAIAMLSGDD